MSMTIPIQSAKLTVVFRAGSLPPIDPARPEFDLDIGGVKIATRINSKAARKLAAWRGAAVLQGKLVMDHKTLCLVDAGFTWIDPVPVPTQPKETAPCP